MKLIILQPYLTLRGGAERVILKIAQHYNAKIYTTEFNKETTFPEFGNLKIEVIKKKVPLAEKLPYRASQGLRYGYNFYNLQIKEDYDVINAHISPSEWARHKNERMLWYCHTPPREVYDLYHERMRNRPYKEKVLYAAFVRVYKLMASRIVKDIEEIVANSKNTKGRIKKYFERDATIINPAIDYEKYSNEGDHGYFIYPSRILLNKRQDYAIGAFAKYQKKTNDFKRKLYIVGTISKDAEHQAYFEKLKKMNVKNVVFMMNVDDEKLRALYSRATAVIFTAMNEDFGYIPLEAMASSKPIISVNEGGPRETIINGKTGFFVNSPDEMAEKMKFLVEHPKVAEEIGKEGRKHVEKNYSWDAFFKKFDAVARRVAKTS